MWIISPEPSMAHRHSMVKMRMIADPINDIELYSVERVSDGKRDASSLRRLYVSRMHANTNGFAGWEMEDLQVRLCSGAIWRNRSG